MTNHDALYGYRLQLFDLARRTTVTNACRVFGVHRSTYYAWKLQVDRQGLDMLRPRERLAGPSRAGARSHLDRASARAMGRPGGITNGVWRVLKRHGLNTRTKRLALIAGYAAPYQPPRETPPQRHVHTDRPGELVGVDCFFVGRLRGSKYPVWQVTAIDCHSSYAWAMLINCPNGQPSSKQTSQLARRVARDLATCGWQLERILTDNGNEFKGSFDQTLTQIGARHTRTRPGRPQTNGHVERLHKTILEECWRPSFARYLHIRFGGLTRDLTHYLHTYNTDRPHHGRITKGRIPTDIIDPAHKMRPQT